MKAAVLFTDADAVDVEETASFPQAKVLRQLSVRTCGWLR